MSLRSTKVQFQPSATADENLLNEARERMKIASDAWRKNRELMIEDVKFRNGDHWPESIKKEREAEDRPCLTINLSEMFIDQVVGDQRQNKPSIKVRPVDGPQLDEDNKQVKVPNIAGDNDYEMADVYTGLIRNIEYNSKADEAYDTAFDHAAGHGLGYFRILTEYADDDTFDQDIRIQRIKNSFRVYLDPSIEDAVASDMMFAFVADWMQKSEFKRRYPSADSLMDISEGIGEEYELWYEEDRVRVAEYFRKVPVTKIIALLSSGEVVDLGENKEDQDSVIAEIESAGLTIKRKRTVKSHRVEWCVINGSHVLEKLKVFPSKYIPIIPVFGKELNVEGETIYRGVIRHYKDPQRMLNYWETTNTETVALQPKAPYVGTHKQFQDNKSTWETANTKNHAYLPYTPDPKASGPPQRETPPQMASGAMERAQSSYQHMLNTTNIQKASLGQEGQEKSGKAIIARQREGDTGNFSYVDNLARSIGQAARVLIDMIPRVYDSERVIRIRQPDDKEDFIKINQVLEDGTVINDLSVGKFDLIVSVGPSYNTMRQEAADAMLEFMRVVPEARPIMMDLVAANMDWPGSDDMARRLRKIIPPDIINANDDDAPEETPPPEPTPAEKAEMAKAEAVMAKAKADIAGAEADIMEAKAKMAEFGASDEAISDMVAEKVAELFLQLGMVPPEGMMPEEQIQ